MFKEGKLCLKKCNGMFNSTSSCNIIDHMPLSMPVFGDFEVNGASALANVNKHEKMFAVNGCLRTVVISCMLVLKFKRVLHTQNY